MRRSSALTCRKGNAILDTLMVMVVIFAFSIISMVVFKAFSEINTDIQADDELSNETKEISGTLHDRFPSLFDGLFIFIFVMLWIVVIVASFNIDSHPIFMVVSVILLAIVLLLGAMISNTYDDIVGDDDFSSSTTEFPMSNFVLSHLVQFILGIGTTIIIVLYGKNAG